jgi:hypothetical protein
MEYGAFDRLVLSDYSSRILCKIIVCRSSRPEACCDIDAAMPRRNAAMNILSNHMFANNTELDEWAAPDCNGKNFFNIDNSRVIE